MGGTSKARYKEVISTYLQTVPPAQRAGISFWGLLDKDSWLVESKPHPDWPLLFDGEGQVKPAFWGVLEALREANRITSTIDGVGDKVIGTYL